jgi:hypothetical protein
MVFPAFEMEKSYLSFFNYVDDCDWSWSYRPENSHRIPAHGSTGYRHGEKEIFHKVMTVIAIWVNIRTLRLS